MTDQVSKNNQKYFIRVVEGENVDIYRGQIEQTFTAVSIGILETVEEAEKHIAAFTSQDKAGHTKKLNALLNESRPAPVKGDAPEETPAQEKELVETLVEIHADVAPLSARMLKVQNELAKSGIGRDAAGTQFSTRSIDAIINAMSIQLTKARIILIPEVTGIDRSDWEKGDKITRHTLVTMRYSFMNADDKDDVLIVEFSGEAADSFDKSLQKACTNAYKYMMIQTFSIPVVGSYDPDLYQDEEAAGPSKPAATNKTLVEEPGVDLEGINLADIDPDNPETPVDLAIAHMVNKLEMDVTPGRLAAYKAWVKNNKLTPEQELQALRKKDSAIVKEEETPA